MKNKEQKIRKCLKDHLVTPVLALRERREGIITEKGYEILLDNCVSELKDILKNNMNKKGKK